QAAWAALGTVALVVLAKLDYHRWRRHSGAFVLVALALLALLLPLGTGPNGATRWIGVGPLTFQPSELAKLALLVWVADLLARRAAYMHNPRATLRPVIVVVAARAHAVMCGPNMRRALWP